MKHARSIFSSLLVLFSLTATGLGESEKTETVFAYQARQLSFSEYLIELDQISALAQQCYDNDRPACANGIAHLRGGWKIVATNQNLKVDTGSFIDEFEKLSKKPDDATRVQLLRSLDELKAEAAAFQQPTPDSATAHAKLNQILARSEFHQVHGPTWWDRLKYRIFEWIIRLLSRFFGASSAPTAGRVLVWTLVAVAVLTLAYFVYRTLRQSARQESAIPHIATVSAKGWRTWIAEAQAAAAKGLWRDAVHLAYWAGISFLEERSAWRPDKARTPREYLRLLPAESTHRPALSALTRKLEVTWYGNDPAGPETFSETITLLEDLGCHQA